MFLPNYRYIPSITEALAETERLRGLIARLTPTPQQIERLRRTAREQRAEAAATLDGRPKHEAVCKGYGFTLEQIGGGWPADRDTAALPVIAGLNFFLTHDPSRHGPPPGLRRTPADIPDYRGGLGIAPGLPPDEVRPAMLELVGWLQSARSAVAPVIRAGIAYRRLMQIWPQQEANAATSCAYCALLLHRADLLPHGLPAFEAGFVADADRYYAALFSGPDSTSWLDYFMGTLWAGLRSAYSAVAAMQTAAPPVVRLNPRQKRIVEILAAPGASLGNEECRQLFGISPVTAARDFRELVELGMVEMQGHGRATFYVSRDSA
ncbi:MAG: Fic family protein [Chloroflexia bacterium]